MKKIYSLVFIAAILLSTVSCSNDDSNAETSSITIEFDNVVGTTNLQLNTTNTPYTNSKGEAYKLTWLTYYVSNIKLKKSDGTVYEDPMKRMDQRDTILLMKTMRNLRR